MQADQFHPITREATKVLVVDLGFLGDTVHLLPALWELKKHYTGAGLHVLTSPLGVEVLKLAPWVDKAWAFPLGPPSPPWWKHWNVIQALRREKFDVAYNFSGADRTIFLTFLSGARWRVAHEACRKHFYNPWLIPCWVPAQNRDLPVFEQRRQVLRACGIQLEPASFNIQTPPEARRWAELNVPAEAIHISINASTHLKEWPLEHSIDLARALLQRDARFVLAATGGSRPREQERLRTFAHAVSSDRVRLFTDLDIPQLAALLQRCRLHIGPDSGVIHLAAALDVPTFSIFRDYDGLKEWLPRGDKHRHAIAECPCARQRHPACQNAGIARCLERITPIAVLDELLKNSFV